MALLKDILYKSSFVSVAGDMNVGVSSLCFDSRESERDCLFFAIRGTQVDGHDFIQKSIDDGAVAIVCETMPDQLESGVTYVQVNNAANALAIAASNFYGNPSER